MKNLSQGHRVASISTRYGTRKMAKRFIEFQTAVIGRIKRCFRRPLDGAWYDVDIFPLQSLVIRFPKLSAQPARAQSRREATPRGT